MKKKCKKESDEYDSKVDCPECEGTGDELTGPCCIENCKCCKGTGKKKKKK